VGDSLYKKIFFMDLLEIGMEDDATVLIRVYFLEIIK
jgi:hypothetical protein